MSKTPEQYNEIACDFVNWFYDKLDEKDEPIDNMFKSKSTMTFCDEECAGENIIVKYNEICENNTVHKVEQVIADPDGSRRINVLVVGNVSIDNHEPQKFTQYFQLCWLKNDGYWIKDTMFTFI